MQSYLFSTTATTALTHRRRRATSLAAAAVTALLAVGLAAGPAQADGGRHGGHGHRGTTLADFAERSDRFVGTAIDNDRLSDPTYRRIASSQFNSVTAENVMKWETIEPSRGEFDFGPGDRLVDFAQRNDQLVYGHVLVWHSQLAPWVTESDFSPQELRTVMTDHITEVAGHYRGQVQRWDVVNEPLNEDGTLRETVFQQKLGESYIADAFRAAHAADPDAELFINDYNMEGITAKTDGMYRLVKRLLAQGVPIDGVGVQGHLTLGNVPEDMRQNLQRFADLGLEVVITELDVRMELPATGAKLVQQAKDYHQVTKACLRVKRCTGITVWGLGDADSWVPGWFEGEGAATLYDEDYRRKPAYHAMRATFAAGGWWNWHGWRR